jgi:hypothetical protein
LSVILGVETILSSQTRGLLCPFLGRVILMQAAEQLFNEGLRHTKALIYHRPGKTWIWGGAKLLPDEIIGELKQRGITITRRTLLNWEKAGLVPEATRGSYGQGGGKWADYPEETIPAAMTAYLLKEVYQLKNADIAEARKGFFEGKPAFFKDTYGRYYTKLEPGKQDFTSLLQTAHEEAEGFKNAEHTLEVFRRHGRGEVRTLKELFTWLENKDGDK